MLRLLILDGDTASDPLCPRWPSCLSQKDGSVKGLGAETFFLCFTAADESKAGEIRFGSHSQRNNDALEVVFSIRIKIKER